MKLFGIELKTREEKFEILKKVVDRLSISTEEKELYLLSLEILDDSDFDTFFHTITLQVDIHGTSQYSIEPLTSQII